MSTIEGTRGMGPLGWRTLDVLRGRPGGATLDAIENTLSCMRHDALRTLKSLERRAVARRSMGKWFATENAPVELYSGSVKKTSKWSHE
jgi:hypothetical protein